MSYAEQMKRYGQQRALKRSQRQQRTVKTTEQLQQRIEQEALRNQRRQQRLERRQADEAWRTTKQNWRSYQQSWRKLRRKDKQGQCTQYEAAQHQWQQQKAARRAQMAQRQAQDETWRQSRAQLQTPQLVLSPTPHKWLAILVIVDNCTRRCLGLPLFTAGAHVTSNLVITALRSLLPVELQFLISDNGPQFKAELFAELADSANFIHIRISPGRPMTNGIAERFVQTLKTWLAAHSWSTPAEMEVLLTEFIAFYNDRPHQGTELKGLSPNEYARRLVTCSTC